LVNVWQNSFICRASSNMKPHVGQLRRGEATIFSFISSRT
jgi:hypothetical protein